MLTQCHKEVYFFTIHRDLYHFTFCTQMNALEKYVKLFYNDSPISDKILT